MQYNIFVEDLPVAAFTDQLMENMKAHMVHNMSEVIQKQRNQSLNIQTKAVLQSCSYKKMF